MDIPTKIVLANWIWICAVAVTDGTDGRITGDNSTVHWILGLWAFISVLAIPALLTYYIFRY